MLTSLHNESLQITRMLLLANIIPFSAPGLLSLPILIHDLRPTHAEKTKTCSERKKSKQGNASPEAASQFSNHPIFQPSPDWNFADDVAVELSHRSQFPFASKTSMADPPLSALKFSGRSLPIEKQRGTRRKGDQGK